MFSRVSLCLSFLPPTSGWFLTSGVVFLFRMWNICQMFSIVYKIGKVISFWVFDLWTVQGESVICEWVGGCLLVKWWRPNENRPILYEFIVGASCKWWLVCVCTLNGLFIMPFGKSTTNCGLLRAKEMSLVDGGFDWIRLISCLNGEQILSPHLAWLGVICVPRLNQRYSC